MRKQSRDQKKKQFKYETDKSKGKKFVDPDALKDNGDNKTLRELAGLGAVLGAAGMAFMPNNTVHAAEQTADQKSAVVGSTVKSETNTATSEVKEEDQNSENTSATTSKSDQPTQSETKSDATSNSENATSESTNSETKSQTSAANSDSTTPSETNSTSNSNSEAESTASKTSVTQANSLEKSTTTSATESNVNSVSGSNGSASARASLTQISNLGNSTVVSASNGSVSLSTGSTGSQASASESTSANSLLNSLSLARTALDTKNLSDAAIAKLLGASFIAKSTNDTIPADAVHVSNYSDLQKAITKGDTYIILDGDITLTSYQTISKSITIDGNGHNIYTNDQYFWVKPSFSKIKGTEPTSLTLKNATTYSSSVNGAVWQDDNGGYNDSNVTLDDVTMNGGTAIFSKTDGTGTSSVNIKGNVTVNAVSSYVDDKGNKHTTSFWSADGTGTTQLYLDDNITVENGAHFTVNGNGLVQKNITLKGNGRDHYTDSHNFTIGDNAVVNINGATKTNVVIGQPASAYQDLQKTNNFTVGDNSTVTMTAPDSNLILECGNSSDGSNVNNVTIGKSTVNFTTDGSVTNNSVTKKKNDQANIGSFGGASYYFANNNADHGTVATSNAKTYINFNKGANVTLTANGAAGNIYTDTQMTVNVNDPQIVTMKNPGGSTYKTVNTNQGIIVNTNNTNIQITHNGKKSTTNYLSTGSSTINTDGTVTKVSGTPIEGMKQDSQDVKDTSLVAGAVNDRGTTEVVYNGKSIPSQSASTSARQSESQASQQQSASHDSQVVSQNSANSQSASWVSHLSQDSKNSKSAASQSQEISQQQSASISHSIHDSQVESQNSKNSQSQARSQASASESYASHLASEASASLSHASQDSANSESNKQSEASASESQARSQASADQSLSQASQNHASQDSESWRSHLSQDSANSESNKISQESQASENSASYASHESQVASQTSTDSASQSLSYAATCLKIPQIAKAIRLVKSLKLQLIVRVRL